MSTSMYLQCINHKPAIESDEITSRNTDEHLAEIFNAIADRTLLVMAYNYAVKNFFGVGSQDEIYCRVAVFLREHPECPIEVVDEYGQRYIRGEFGVQCDGKPLQ